MRDTHRPGSAVLSASIPDPEPVIINSHSPVISAASASCDLLAVSSGSTAAHTQEPMSIIPGPTCEDQMLRATGEPCILNEKQAVVAGQLGSSSDEVRILLDSGATNNFIDQDFVNSRNLKSIRYCLPKRLTLFDGEPTSAGPIISFVKESLVVAKYSSQAKFDVTRLSGVQIVLGYSWLKENAVIINFDRRVVSFRQTQEGAESQERAEQLALPNLAESSPILAGEQLSALARKSSFSLKSTTSSSPSYNRAVSKTVRFKPLPKYRSSSKSASKFKPPFKSWSSWPTFRIPGGVVKPPNCIPVSQPIKWTSNNSPLRDTEKVEPVEQLWATIESPHEGGIDSYRELTKLPSFGVVELTQQELDDINAQVPEMYREYLDIFHPRLGTETLAPTRRYDLKIELMGDAKLTPAPLYQLSPPQMKVLKETLDREVAAGRIRPSNSPYGSPTFFVAKKDGRWRMVVDFRRLNIATIPDAYPLPLISQIIGDLAKSKFFTKLDLVGAYQLLRVAEGYEFLTAFRTPMGMYESLVVRDGLRNAPAVFQHFLNEVLTDLIGQGVIVYIDDILIHSSSLNELRRLTRLVFDRIRASSLFLKAAKCKFERESITFLGFVVSGKGVEANPSFVQGVTSFPTPRTLKETQRFLGLAGYYRRFVPQYSRVAKPLSFLTSKNIPFKWEADQENAFLELKRLMSTAPVLAHFNPEYETIVQTDASLFGWGFVISQVNDRGEEHPVAIESGSFTGAELNYTVTEKEFLAIVLAFRRQRHLLMQVTSTVVTDHLT